MSTSNDPRRGMTTPANPHGSHPVGERRRRGWLLPLLLAVLAAIALLALLSRCGGDDDASRTTGAGGTASASATTPSASGTQDGATPSATETGSASGAGEAGTVTSAGTVLLSDTEAKPLEQFRSKPAVATRVKVQSVPADEGFWVGASEDDRLWVQLTGEAGESAYTVKQGDEVDFTGVVTSHGQDFPAEVGVTDAEGASTLAEQRGHLSVRKEDVELAE